MIIAKNSTQETITVQVTSSKTVDVGVFDKVNLLSYFSRSELAQARDLANKIKDGLIILNDGAKDLDWIEAIDILKDFQDKTEKDPTGRWIVRSDSRRLGYDIVFAGAGDDTTNRIIGGGAEFRWDFSAASQDPLWITSGVPSGYKRQRIEWQFMEGVYMKEGSFYFYNAPKGTYIDMYIVCPPGGYYDKKFLDEEGNITQTFHQAETEIVFGHWVVRYPLEGTCPMGDELNTEASSDLLTPEYIIWRAEVTSPEVTGLTDFHGHFTLEFNRGRTVAWPQE